MVNGERAVTIEPRGILIEAGGAAGSREGLRYERRPQFWNRPI
jgi:hypothetical protein